MRQAAKVVGVVVCLLGAGMVGTAQGAGAADLNQGTLRGDVASVELIYSGSGQYQETLIGISSWGFTTAPFVPIFVRCNGVVIQSCMNPANFLPCNRQQETVWNVGNTQRTERYECTPPSRADAGACVNVDYKVDLLDPNTYEVYNERDQRQGKVQAVSLDVQSIALVTSGWVSSGQDCTPKG